MKKGELIFEKKNIFETKSTESLTRQIDQALETISSKSENLQEYGSFNYRSQPYPSDIDLRERLFWKGGEKFVIEPWTDKNGKKDYVNISNLDSAVKEIEKRLLKIIRQIYQADNSYLSEVKCGLDPYFYFISFYFVAGFTGEAKHKPSKEDPNYWTFASLEEDQRFQPEKIKQVFDSYFSKGLIDREYYDRMRELLKHPKKQDTRERVYSLLREKFIIRWSLEDLGRGYKYLPGDRRRSLSQCIRDPTLLKVDMLTFILDRWVEVTNLFDTWYYNKSLKSVDVVTSSEDPEIGLKEEVYKYASSPLFQKPFKLAKRLFALARLQKNYPDGEILVKLFQSEYGELNQIRSEIETLNLMFERLEKPPLHSMFEQIDNYKQRFSTILNIKLDTDHLYGHIDQIIKIRNFQRDEAVKLLTEISDYLKKIIDPFTDEYLKKNGLLPVPERYFLKQKYQYYEVSPSFGGDTREDIEQDPFVKELRELRLLIS